MRLDGLFENIDDKDEFIAKCPVCDLYGDEQPDVVEFHDAHMASAKVADVAPKTAPWWNFFKDDMAKRGYQRQMGVWVRVPVTEDLDDKDEFMSAHCDYCENVHHYDPSNIDFDAFHIAHTQSEELATDETNWFDDDTFISEMRKRGYEKQRYLNRFLWTKTTPLKEDLDDKDEFGAPGISAAYYENSGGHYRHVVVFADGSRLYAHTLPSDAGGDYFEKFRDSTGALHDDNWPGIVEYENAMGQHRNSYYVPFTPEIWADWKKAFGALTEDIDDKDEFKKDCMVCRVNCALNPKLNQEDYHNAHEASKLASGVGLDNPNLYVTEMAKYGYFKDYNYGMWVKR